MKRILMCLALLVSFFVLGCQSDPQEDLGTGIRGGGPVTGPAYPPVAKTSAGSVTLCVESEYSRYASPYYFFPAYIEVAIDKPYAGYWVYVEVEFTDEDVVQSSHVWEDNESQTCEYMKDWADGQGYTVDYSYDYGYGIQTWQMEITSSGNWVAASCDRMIEFEFAHPDSVLPSWDYDTMFLVYDQQTSYSFTGEECD